MDRISETSFIITQLNKYSKHEIPDDDFIKSVCRYYDQIKNCELNEYDYYFLKYVSDKSGIPLYFDMLNRFSHDLSISNINLQMFSSMLYESTLYTDKKTHIHKYQKEILDKFNNNEINRFLLTASTSFGKTFLIYEIIRKMKYRNILLIFPSIALLAENLEKILTNEDYLFIKNTYKIFTLSEIDELGDNNIFIYTPERYLSFTEKNKIDFDFIFIDEIYKIDNEFEMDDEIKENERDTAYRLTSILTSNLNCDFLLAGPYIKIINNSFYSFLQEKKIVHLDYNKYEIVDKKIFTKKRNKYICNDSDISIELPEKSTKKIDVITIVNYILARKENAILYCSYRGKNYGTEYYGELLSKEISFDCNDKDFVSFLEHLENTYSKDWIVYKALKKGIGIHHGLVPKYIQKEIINFFNNKAIPLLISTTTITEGVNTSAKNLLVLLAKKGNKPLLSFDAKNITGRAGRLGYHYSGNVFDLTRDFKKLVETEASPLKHKNFDNEIDKDDIDIFFTENTYLTEHDINNRNQIIEMQKERRIPSEILSMYKMISWKDKITIYDSIMQLNPNDRNALDVFIERNYRNYKYFNLQNIQLIVDILQPIIKNATLLGLINTKDKNGRYSILLYSMETYLDKGLMGLIHYYCSVKTFYDEAVNISTKFVYNTLKYQVVKYFGAFNIMYKYIRSREEKCSFDDAHGIDKLLRYFEYTALSDIGRKISDYGVPSKVISYYEESSAQKKEEIANTFDVYERSIYEKTKKIVSSM